VVVDGWLLVVYKNLNEKTFSDHSSGLDVEYSIIADKHNLPKVA